MWLQFYLENFHFAVNLFAALVFFAVSWLYLDAWLGRKNFREGTKFTGFLLLSISFLVHGTKIELPILAGTGLSANLYLAVFLATRITGYILVIISLVIDPLMAKPVTVGIGGSVQAGVVGTAKVKLLSLGSLVFLNPLLSLTTGALYLRRATLGLENHLKLVAVSFFALSAFEIISLRSLFETTDNVDLYNLVKVFGPLWVVEHLMLMAAVTLLGRWVFSYLLKRIQSQLFMFFTSSIVAIFLLTTISFTALLLNNLQKESLEQLETNVKVLNLSIQSSKDQTLSDALVVAQNPQIISALKNRDRTSLAVFSTQFLLGKKQSFLIIVDENGQVLARGEDKNRIGNSMSDDTLIKRALLGENGSSVIAKMGVMDIPAMNIRGAVAVRDQESIIGAVMTGYDLDNAFVDGLQKATGLATSIYGGNKLSSTTLRTADGKSRPLGISEANKTVNKIVITDNKPYSGPVKILNVPYFASYLPLTDIDNTVVGMLFVGKEQVGVLQTAGRSIELTFMITVLLLIIAVLPAYLISRYVSNQVHI